MARVEQALANLNAAHVEGAEFEPLATAWQEFVALLAVPDAPVRRHCPFCSGPIMRDATLCMYCWKKSLPPSGGGGQQPA